MEGRWEPYVINFNSAALGAKWRPAEPLYTADAKYLFQGKNNHQAAGENSHLAENNWKILL